MELKVEVEAHNSLEENCLLWRLRSSVAAREDSVVGADCCEGRNYICQL